MNSSAFVTATPFASRTIAASLATSAFTQRRVTAPTASKRATLVMKVDDKRIPQGFTFFSERLNGRAAMLGFTLAIVTEFLTGEGIVGQVSAVVKNVEHILPL